MRPSIKRSSVLLLCFYGLGQRRVAPTRQHQVLLLRFGGVGEVYHQPSCETWEAHANISTTSTLLRYFQVLISFFIIFTTEDVYMFRPIGTHQYSQKLQKKIPAGVSK